MRLIAIRLFHTLIRAFLAGCILALPIFTFLRVFDWAAILATIIIMECMVLALNHGRCPLTGLATHFTGARVDNFDIYLPLWLARYNKLIFGTLFIINELIVLAYLRGKRTSSIRRSS